MHIKKEILVFILFLFYLVNNVIAQKNWENAENTFKKKDYITAIELYQKLFTENTKQGYPKAEAFYHLGKCYLELLSYEKAEKWFDRAFAEHIKQPNIYYDYAELLRVKGEYKRAMEYYLLLKKELPQNTQIAEKGIKSCLYALNLESSNIFAECIRQPDVSSPGEEKNPIFYNDTLFYLSSVFFQDLEKENKRKFLLYKAIVLNNNFVSPSIISGIHKKDITAFTFDPSSDLFFFAVEESKNKVVIYLSSFNSGKWQRFKKLFALNTIGSLDGMSFCYQEQRLYFSAELKNGNGGKDIWYSNLQAGRWTQPINAGTTINTEKDEVSPFIWNDSLLFFSSNGQMENYGGFDIYVSKYENDNFCKPINLGKPFNSSYDDIGFSLHYNNDLGVLSSNRVDENMGFFKLNNPFSTGCYIGKVTDSSKKIITNAEINIFDGNEKILKTRTNENGNYNFFISKNKEYTIKISKPNYFTSYITINDLQQRDRSITLEYGCIEKNIILDYFSIEQKYNLENIFPAPYTTELSAKGKYELNKISHFLLDNEHLSIHFTFQVYSSEEDIDYIKFLSSAKIDSIFLYFSENNISSSRLSSDIIIDSASDNKTPLTDKFYFQLFENNSKFIEKNKISADDMHRIIVNSKKPPVKVVPPKHNTYTIQIDPKNRKIEDILKALSEKAPEIEIFTEAGPDGKIQYFAGTFLIKTGAENRVKKLKKIGINSSIKEDKVQ